MCGRFGLGGWIVLAALTIGHASFLWYHRSKGHVEDVDGTKSPYNASVDAEPNTKGVIFERKFESHPVNLAIEVNPARLMLEDFKKSNPRFQMTGASLPGRTSRALFLQCFAVSQADSITVHWTQAIDDDTVSAFVVFASRQGGKRHAVTPHIPVGTTHTTLAMTALGGIGIYTFQVVCVHGNTYGCMSAPSNEVVVNRCGHTISI